MTMQKARPKTSLLDMPVLSLWHIDLEVALYILLGVVAVVACFYNLGARTQSHDESLHALYSWKLYNGEGYEHNPMMHGPFLFHANALVYFLFGVSDFTARIVPALFGVTLVLLPAFLRKELGRVGALVTSVLFLISPSTLFHARYIRDDIYMMVWAMLMAIGLFRYLDSRKPGWIYLAVLGTTMSLCTMETAYITGFIGLTFLFILFVQQMLRPQAARTAYAIGVVLLIGLVITLFILNAQIKAQEASEGAKRLKQLAEVVFLFIGIVIVMLLGSVVIKRDERLKPALALIMAYLLMAGALLVLCTAAGGLVWFIFVQLPAGVMSAQAFLVLQVLLAGLGAGAGGYGWWRLFRYAQEREWLPAGFQEKVLYITLVLFAVPFVLLYTTFFTNPKGLGTGAVGAVTYWLAQQEVKRAGQPWYYYFVITPLYDFLPIGLGLIATLYYLITGKVDRPEEVAERAAEEKKPYGNKFPTLPLVAYAIYWTLSAWLIYSWAGEKMPWLMVHITQPMIVLSGRFVDDIIYGVDWQEVWRKGGALLLLLTPIILFALGTAVGMLVWGQAFRGVSLTDINHTGKWLLAVLVGASLVVAAWQIRKRIGNTATWRVAFLSVLLVGSLFTVRYAWMACYVNYDTAKEFLVYAHSTPDVKQTVEELKEISRRLYGDERSIRFAYSSDATWPFEWYFDTNFPNRLFMGKEPSRENTDVPVLIIGREEISKVEPFLGKRYYRFDRKLIWWPHQDYYMTISFALPGQDLGKVISRDAESLTVDISGTQVKLWADARTKVKIKDMPQATLQNVNPGDRVAGQVVKREDGAFLLTRVNVLEPFKSYFFLDMQDEEKRRAFFDVVFYRKYKQSLADWEPSHPYALYIRKDIAAQLWDFGVAPAAADMGEDQAVYEKVSRPLDVVSVIGYQGVGEGQFVGPRNVAIGPDDFIYVLDSGNHRVQKLTADGLFVTAWGHMCKMYENREGCEAADGAGGFFDPWGIGVDAEGFVYVADTWNHRIQKFTSDGQFVTAWGQYGVVDGAVGGESLFWGPRGVAIGSDGLVYVSDTGNKRIQVFTPDGQFVTQWGGKGIAEGQFDEPVGLAVDASGLIYVADAWNQRVQVFDSGRFFLRKWELDTWYGQSLQNKPYLAVDAQGQVYVSDPEEARILVFDAAGRVLASLGQYGTDDKSFVLPMGVAIDSQGYIYVADPGANRVVKLAPG